MYEQTLLSEVGTEKCFVTTDAENRYINLRLVCTDIVYRELLF